MLHPDSADAKKLPGSFSEWPVAKGSVVRVETPAGAGYGDPMARDPALVRADVQSGKVSAAVAEQAYGVVITDDAVDAEKTCALRAARANGGTE